MPRQCRPQKPARCKNGSLPDCAPPTGPRPRGKEGVPAAFLLASWQCQREGWSTKPQFSGFVSYPALSFLSSSSDLSFRQQASHPTHTVFAATSSSRIFNTYSPLESTLNSRRASSLHSLLAQSTDLLIFLSHPILSPIMASFRSPPVLLGIVVFFLLIRRTYAFGAGNIASISKVEGQNWRHGDIEDTLLQLIMARAVGGKKFDKLSVSRVYFGNWLRDYSQAIDVGALKAASAEAIRLLLSVLGFLTFGYGSREFEITADRLGTYRPEDHIDNPKNYADNIDARDYDRRLRGPVDESVELAVDPETGMKNYIANENVGIMTSALHVRKLFGRSIELGRSYGNSNNKSELYEALRLLGTGLHCLEDFLAHSNYTELALIELGERDVFPHVGRGTQIRIEGARNEVYPLVTGTFGGVDFLHSVTGEVSDKLTQNEIQELEGTLKNSQNSDTSILRDLLDKIPDGLFSSGDKKQELDNIQSNAAAAQMQQVSVSPRDPEEFTLYVQNIFAQVKPVIEFHDDILQAITETIENIPILPKIVEQLEDQLSVFVFSVIAPFVVPLIDQIKNELQTGASEIIQSSKNEQYVVFENDDSSDPTHSMLSKDHFSNILNEVAGRTASKVVGWVVPQLMEAWDDDSVDIDRTLNRIIYGVLHHPAQREIGNDGVTDGRAILFRSVKEWWQDLSDEQRDEYRQKLSRQGVQNGENHKAGVHDTGHGCGHPIGMHKNYGGGNETAEDKIASAAAGAIIGGVTSGFSSIIEQNTGYQVPHQESSSSGGLGGLLSSLGGNSGGGDSGGLLGAATSFLSSGRDESGSRRETEGGYSGQSGGYEGGNRYGQEQSGRNEYSGGEERPQRRRDDDNSGGGYGGSSGGYGSSGGGYGREEPSYGGGGYGGRDDGGGGGGFRREEPPFGGGGGGGFGREEPPFGGRGGGGGYGRDEAPSGWGGGREDRREDRRGEESGWGGDRHHDGRHHDGRRRDDNRPNWGGDRQEERRYGEDEDDRHRRERRNEGGGWGN